MGRIVRAGFIVMALAGYATALKAGDADIGLSFLSQGKVEEAREYLSRAYRTDSLSPSIRFAYARILEDGGAAQKLYAGVARDTTAPDSLRAAAWYLLGGGHECRGGYDSAYACYTEAVRLHPSADHMHRQALAALCRGRHAEAESIWAAQAAGDDSVSAARALVHLGRAAAERAEAGDTASAVKQAGEDEWKEAFNDDKQTEPAKAGDTAAAAKRPASEGAKGAGRYTCQIGAFASVENALRLRDTMKKEFGHVTIISAHGRDTVLHKVRVGSFQTEDEALAFGEKHLRARGVLFRVVKE